LKHTVPTIIDAHVLQAFLDDLGTGSTLPKSTFWAKINGRLG